MSFPPYQEYKDSGVEWLGQIPSEWGVGQYKLLVDIQNGSDHKDVEVEDGFPVIGSGGAFAFASDYLYDGESVLLGRKGTIDKPLFVVGKFWTVDTMYWTKIHPSAHGKFAFYVALTIPFGYYSTNTALPSMTKSALEAHQISLPTVDEQVMIAAFLDHETAKIDALVAEQQRLIELLHEKRQAVISHAVTKGLDPSVPMKDSGVEWIGQVPLHWNLAKLRHLTSRISSGKTPSGGSETYVDEGVIFIRSQNVYDDGLRLDDVAFISEEVDESMASSRIVPGDILLNITGASIGRTCVVTQDLESANVNQHVCAIRLMDQSQVAYVSLFMKSDFIKKQIDFIQNGAAREGLNFEQIGQFFCLLPSLEEQKQIANFVGTETTKFESLLEEAQAAIDLLQERRSALISAAVTGKIDVSNWQAKAQEEEVPA